MNPLSFWIDAHGGLIGLGVELAKWSLILFSMASLSVVAERVLALRRLDAKERAAYPKLVKWMKDSNLAWTRAFADSEDAPCAAMVLAGIERLDANSAHWREAIERETTRQIVALSFNLPVLATAASTAPYVGLFGTVLGILAAFRQIVQSGQTGAAVVAGGISEALTATALGLGVAIPAVIAYNYFSGRVNALALDFEMHAQEITAYLEEWTEKEGWQKPAPDEAISAADALAAAIEAAFDE